MFTFLIFFMFPLLCSGTDQWYKVRNSEGCVGLVPANYVQRKTITEQVEPTPEPTPEPPRARPTRRWSRDDDALDLRGTDAAQGTRGHSFCSPMLSRHESFCNKPHVGRTSAGIAERIALIQGGMGHFGGVGDGTGPARVGEGGPTSPERSGPASPERTGPTSPSPGRPPRHTRPAGNPLTSPFPGLPENDELPSDVAAKLSLAHRGIGTVRLVGGGGGGPMLPPKRAPTHALMPAEFLHDRVDTIPECPSEEAAEQEIGIHLLHSFHSPFSLSLCKIARLIKTLCENLARTFLIMYYLIGRFCKGSDTEIRLLACSLHSFL